MPFLIIITLLNIFVYAGTTWDDIVVYSSWLIGVTVVGVFLGRAGFSFGKAATQIKDASN
ncbi:MAG: hypothetical protein C9356_20145 [Oleiphilus sp.]|nr:MAG: hypothetical protein C9356_20145 [Oleiphilus sp.]